MGQMTRPSYETAIEQLGILDALSAYDARIAGTPPLGVATADSDLDILCHAPDASAFLSDVVRHYAACEGFHIRQWTSNKRPMIATFRAQGWDFEIFASPEPVDCQAGWRHFRIEKRLLALGGPPFKDTIRRLRQTGLKTEPAFWSALSKTGDAYRGLLTLETSTDETLDTILAEAGFGQENTVHTSSVDH